MSINGFYAKNHLLADYTSWRIGGPARYFFKPHNVEGLALFLSSWSSKPVYFFGSGSNVLIRDGGINGLVICLYGQLNRLHRSQKDVLRVEAGVSLARLVKAGVDLGMVDLAFLAGIPGTVGGALRMNAGAYGYFIWEQVISLETIDYTGKIRLRKLDEFQVGYREVLGLDWQREWFVAAYFRISCGGKERARKIMLDTLTKRRASQPFDFPSCGSVFKNPPNDYAARLIEKHGLKGYRIGNAEISKKHANFIVNKGGATAKEVEGLIDYVADKILRADGVRLLLELHILGDFAT